MACFACCEESAILSGLLSMRGHSSVGALHMQHPLECMHGSDGHGSRTEDSELIHHGALFRPLALRVAVVAHIEHLFHVDRLRRDEEADEALAHGVRRLRVRSNHDMHGLAHAVERDVLHARRRGRAGTARDAVRAAWKTSGRTSDTERSVTESIGLNATSCFQYIWWP